MHPRDDGTVDIENRTMVNQIDDIYVDPYCSK